MTRKKKQPVLTEVPSKPLRFKEPGITNANGEKLYQCHHCKTPSGRSPGGKFRITNLSAHDPEISKLKNKRMFGRHYVWEKCVPCGSTGLLIEKKKGA